MAAIATLVINDGQTTPVVHNFGPVNIIDDVAKWTDRVGGIAIGFPQVTFSLRNPSKTGGSRSYKITAKVVLPVLEVTSPSTATGIQPAPTKAYDLLGNIELILPERSSLAQRKDLLAYCQNLLANAIIANGVANYESVF